MSPVNFSICGSEKDAMLMQTFLEPYNASHSSEARVDVTNIPWDESKNTLTQMALYDRGEGVSEVGAVVVNDLVAMNALRPFSATEFASMGGQAAFSKIAWDSTNRIADGRVCAIPWMVDPRGFFYWRDMLAEAGVDEQTAFDSAKNFEETLVRLQNAGHALPLGLANDNAFVAGQASFSWVWGAGVDFFSADSRHTYVTDPAFLDALYSYFRLAPYIIPDDWDTPPFITRQCAVAYGSMWSVTEIIADSAHPLRSLLGIALPPGAPFAGGSNLVLWKNTRNEQDGLELIRYLTGRNAQTTYPLQVNHLPARQEVLDQPPYATDSILSGFVRLVNAARPFPAIQLGGLLETLYCTSIARIWKRIAHDPQLNLKDAINSEMSLLSRRYEKWVG